MTLKLATLEDLDDLDRLFQNFFSNSPYSNLVYDRDKVSQFSRDNFKRKDDFLFLLSLDSTGTPQGFLLAVKAPPLFSSESIASEIAWWVEPEHRSFKTSSKMLDAYEYWAKLVGCKEATLAHLETPKSKTIAKWYTRRGYKPRESAFIKELN